jgi:D-alanine-D-alanine ligase
MRQEVDRVVVVYETQASCEARLGRFGFGSDVAAEIAVYLAQSADLPEYFEEIREALAAEGAAVDFVELDALADLLPTLVARADRTLLWSQTDGIRFYRGSSAPFAARLTGVARYGSSPFAQALCQNKFQCLALAETAGVTISPTLLLEGRETLARLGRLDPSERGFFVKPNTLGGKIGIFADSRCSSLAEARERAQRLWDRYRDRAVVQPFVEGDDVRLSFMDVGGAFADQLGPARLVKQPGSETGGAFMTMKDNQTLSGAKDLRGARGGFGLGHAAAFTPDMVDLRAEKDERSRRARAAIAEQAERLARLVGLADYFSMDFRIDETGAPTFFEFETCPAVTIYDFQTYLRSIHDLSLGAALARSMRRAHRECRSAAEA